MKYLAKTGREKVLLEQLEKLYIAKADQFNELAPADCGVSHGEIEDGLAQLSNRISKLLDAIKPNTRDPEPGDIVAYKFIDGLIVYDNYEGKPAYPAPIVVLMRASEVEARVKEAGK